MSSQVRSEYRREIRVRCWKLKFDSSCHWCLRKEEVSIGQFDIDCQGTWWYLEKNYAIIYPSDTYEEFDVWCHFAPHFSRIFHVTIILKLMRFSRNSRTLTTVASVSVWVWSGIAYHCGVHAWKGTDFHCWQRLARWIKNHLMPVCHTVYNLDYIPASDVHSCHTLQAMSVAMF